MGMQGAGCMPGGSHRVGERGYQVCGHPEEREEVEKEGEKEEKQGHTRSGIHARSCGAEKGKAVRGRRRHAGDKVSNASESGQARQGREEKGETGAHPERNSRSVVWR